MFWEYLIVGLMLAWALFYLWRLFAKKRGCSCEECPASQQSCCSGTTTPEGICVYTEDGQQKSDEEEEAVKK